MSPRPLLLGRDPEHEPDVWHDWARERDDAEFERGERARARAELPALEARLQAAEEAWLEAEAALELAHDERTFWRDWYAEAQSSGVSTRALGPCPRETVEERVMAADGDVAVAQAEEQRARALFAALESEVDALRAVLGVESTAESEAA